MSTSYFDTKPKVGASLNPNPATVMDRIKFQNKANISSKYKVKFMSPLTVQSTVTGSKAILQCAIDHYEETNVNSYDCNSVEFQIEGESIVAYARFRDKPVKREGNLGSGSFGYSYQYIDRMQEFVKDFDSSKTQY